MLIVLWKFRSAPFKNNTPSSKTTNHARDTVALRHVTDLQLLVTGNSSAGSNGN
jgi:hypothetical protein